MSLKDQHVTFGWSEVALLGSIVLFVTSTNLWSPFLLLSLSAFGKLAKYSIELQKEKSLNESINSVVANIMNPDSSAKNELSDINKAINNIIDFE